MKKPVVLKGLRASFHANFFPVEKKIGTATEQFTLFRIEILL